MDQDITPPITDAPPEQAFATLDASADIAVAKEPTPTDPMMGKISGLLQQHFDTQGWRFSVQGREMASADIVASTGLLPILAFRASTLYEEAMNKPMPLYYFPNPDALCEVSPGVEEGPGNTMIMWGHFMHYAAEEWVKRYPKLLAENAPIPLDDMYDQWFEAAQSAKLKFRETLAPRATVSTGRGR